MNPGLPNHKNVGGILLAAGSSSRLGQSKQLLDIEGEPLLVRSVNALLGAGLGRVVVVLGSGADENKKLISSLPVELVINEGWPSGMGSSLKAGVRQMMQGTVPDAMLISVCDQPLLGAHHLISLIEHFELHESPYVASMYGDTLGPPALFSPAFYDRLAGLPDQAGAKKLFDGSGEGIEFPEGNLDIDTPEDYARLREIMKKGFQ